MDESALFFENLLPFSRRLSSPPRSVATTPTSTSLMINTKSTVNVAASPATANPAPDKQIPKKTALRDVQNEKVGLIHKPQDIILSGVPKPNGEAVKVCGTKRLTPERPSSSHVLPSLAHNGANENVMNARRRFELELGRGRLYSNVEKNSEFSELKNVGIAQKTTTTTHHLASKHVNSVPAAKVVQEVPHVVESKANGDHLRAERFARLQKFLKQCDEAKQGEYSKRLLHLSPLELSKHAVELEKRAIQLTIEEGNEMQRMKALNILAKPDTTNNLVQSNQLLQSSKR